LQRSDHIDASKNGHDAAGPAELLPIRLGTLCSKQGEGNDIPCMCNTDSGGVCGTALADPREALSTRPSGAFASQSCGHRQLRPRRPGISTPGHWSPPRGRSPCRAELRPPPAL